MQLMQEQEKAIFVKRIPKPVCYPSGNLCLWTITVPHLNLGRIFPFILKQSDEKKKRADEKK